MTRDRRDVGWSASPGMDLGAAGEYFIGLLKLPERMPDRDGEVGRATWSIWVEPGEGICFFDGRPCAALLLTDLCGPGRRLTVLALCVEHSWPERWMARTWREVRESGPEMAPGDVSVTLDRAARLN